mgnify:FL=1|jgi:hypothetical protein|tara:strand:+ start:621 stop:926 length:306 start_codon:yes stop_codon:yes gene_type:complete
MTERDYIQQDHRTQRARTIDKADRLVSDLETLETQLSAVIGRAESIRDELELTTEPDWPAYSPAVYRQLRDTVHQLRQKARDPSVRLDLARVAKILTSASG